MFWLASILMASASAVRLPVAYTLLASASALRLPVFPVGKPIMPLDTLSFGFEPAAFEALAAEVAANGELDGPSEGKGASFFGDEENDAENGARHA